MEEGGEGFTDKIIFHFIFSLSDRRKQDIFSFVFYFPPISALCFFFQKVGFLNFQGFEVNKKEGCANGYFPTNL